MLYPTLSKSALVKLLVFCILSTADCQIHPRTHRKQTHPISFSTDILYSKERTLNRRGIPVDSVKITQSNEPTNHEITQLAESKCSPADGCGRGAFG